MLGLKIMGCLPGSPAEKMGLQKGDVLISINDTPVNTLSDFAVGRLCLTARPLGPNLISLGRHGAALENGESKMANATYSARIFNSGFGYESRKDGLTFEAAKKHAAKAQRDGGYGWHAEILDETNKVVFSRAYRTRSFIEHI